MQQNHELVEKRPLPKRGSEDVGSLVILRRNDPQAYSRHMDKLTSLEERDEESTKAVMSRSEELELMKTLKREVLEGMPPSITDTKLLTSALFFTAGTFFGYESEALVQKAISVFIEYGAKVTRDDGRQLADEFRFTGNETGLKVLRNLDLV